MVMSADPDFSRAFSDYLSKRLSTDLVADRTSWGPRREAALRELADLSFSSALLSEKLGGLGLGASDVVPLFFQAGARLLPLPLLDAVVNAAVVANHVADPEGALTQAVLSGAFVPVVSQGDTPWAQGELDEGVVAATDVLVEAGDLAQQVVLACRAAGEPAYVLVDVDASQPRPAASVDPCRTWVWLRLSDRPAQLLLKGEQALACHDELTRLGRLAVAAETAGLMRATLESATEYAKIREQFGRLIGSFQAHKHLLAGCWRDCYSLDAICESAAAAVDRTDEDADALVLAAKAWSAKVGRHTIEQTLQAFGAVGFTAEHPQHLFLKRVLTLEGQLGESESLLIQAGRGVVARAAR
jgi:alkylation response protein AidB-like acyl-CoA dehydrogenase